MPGNQRPAWWELIVDRTFTNMPRHLTGAVALAIGVYIINILFSREIPEGNRDIALVVLGIAIKWTSDVVGFHYHSSDGSKRKSETISEMERRDDWAEDDWAEGE